MVGSAWKTSVRSIIVGSNRPFPISLLTLFQIEALWNAFHMNVFYHM